MADAEGGITSSGSLLSIRAISSLSSGLPTTTEPCFAAAPGTSSRRSALRWLRSGPWQAKQFSERIGRMSRLKRTFSSPRVVAARPCGSAPVRALRHARDPDHSAARGRSLDGFSRLDPDRAVRLTPRVCAGSRTPLPESQAPGGAGTDHNVASGCTRHLAAASNRCSLARRPCPRVKPYGNGKHGITRPCAESGCEPVQRFRPLDRLAFAAAR